MGNEWASVESLSTGMKLQTVAPSIDLMLIRGLEVTRSMSVLTGSDCISLYGETTCKEGG